MTALESHPSNNDNNNDDDASTIAPTKYLTSSRLLAIQLTDPDFRIHVLSQFLIVCHHLTAQVPVLKPKLADLEKRAKTLFNKIVPHGVQHLKLLESILQSSEEQWRQWKKNKCQPDLDKPLCEPSSRNKRKRRMLDGALGGEGDSSDVTDDDEQGKEESYQALTLKDDLPDVSNQMRRVVPQLDTHLADYIEALDPDAGIEDEYHPKNNALFSWRAIRLLSEDHLAHFSRIQPSGDFEGMVRHVYQQRGVEIPGEAPEVAQDSSESESEKEEVQEDEDTEMQDADEAKEGEEEPEPASEELDVEDKEEENVDKDVPQDEEGSGEVKDEKEKADEGEVSTEVDKSQEAKLTPNGTVADKKKPESKEDATTPEKEASTKTDSKSPSRSPNPKRSPPRQGDGRGRSDHDHRPSNGDRRYENGPRRAPPEWRDEDRRRGGGGGGSRRRGSRDARRGGDRRDDRRDDWRDDRRGGGGGREHGRGRR